MKRKSQDVANPDFENMIDLEGFEIDDDDSDECSDRGCVVDDVEKENREIPPGVTVT